MASLNETFDAGTAERFAMETKFPYQLLCLLAGMALLSMAAFGYQLGMNGHRLPVLVAILIAVWTTMLVVILDLGAPRLGVMRTNSAVYDWTLEGMSDRRSGPSASTTH
jgi:predicted benzoate:H+ symporter BenE